MNKINIHGTCISYQDKGILFIGASGSGKSDLALQMIMNNNALLVADDRTNIEEKQGQLIASCPKSLLGLMEVRGIGICRFNSVPSVVLSLVVELVPQNFEIERLPQIKNIQYLGIQIPKICIHGYETSATNKIILACYQNK